MKKLLFFLLLIATMSCNDDDQAVNIFEFSASQKTGSLDEWWIAVYDNETGELLDYQQLTITRLTDPLQPAFFHSKKSITENKLTVAIIRASQDGSTNTSVYRDIEVGSQWAVLPLTTYNFQDTLTLRGSYHLEITNAPPLFSMSVSDGVKLQSFYSDVVSENKITTDVGIYLNSQFIYIDPLEGNPKYLELTVEKNVPVSLDFNDFKTFEKYVTVDFPEPLKVDRIYHAGPELSFESQYIYELYFGSPAVMRKSITLGYVNDNTLYNTNIRAGHWTNLSTGTPPTSIEYVSNEGYTTTGNTIDDFKITTTKDYLYAGSTFGYSEGEKSMTVTYFIPKTGGKLFDVIPEEIASKYQIKKSQLVFRNGSFQVKGYSYPDMIRSTYDKVRLFSTHYSESSVDMIN